MGSRFQLNSTEPAMVQLWRASRIATHHILKQHSYYGLTREDRDSLVEDVMLGTVRHFITYKVKQHTYNRKYDFMNNVISSCWSCSGNIADTHVKRVILKANTFDITPMQYGLSLNDRFPLYLAEYEKRDANRRRKDLSGLKRPFDRAMRVRELYEDYVAEVEYMQLGEVMDFDTWVSRNGYNKDPELMYALLSKEEKKELAAAEAECARNLRDSDLSDRAVRTRIYMREYKRRMREKAKEAKSRDFEKLYGAPPPGCRWVLRNGIVGIQRVKK